MCNIHVIKRNILITFEPILIKEVMITMNMDDGNTNHQRKKQIMFLCKAYSRFPQWWKWKDWNRQLIAFVILRCNCTGCVHS